jgi:hypothetical protein
MNVSPSVFSINKVNYGKRGRPLSTQTGFAAVLFTILAGCAVSGTDPLSNTEDSTCTLLAGDQAWIDRAVSAWRVARDDIAGIGEIDHFKAIFFSSECVVSSENALVGADSAVTWNAMHHDGTITLPDGVEIPAGVTSFTSAADDKSYFVMSTPSVWRAGGVDGGPLELETLMVAVMLHEGVHVAQSPTYGQRVTALEKRYSLPESFSDDSLQTRFEQEQAFASSVARETDLFFQAAVAADDESARRLAQEARALMLARSDRWFTGDDVYWRESEDVWLTFEGSGQWVGYQWLVSDHGAAASVSSAMTGFGRRSRWWSQNQGLGIALTLDRLGDPGWKYHAFGDGAQTLLEMLDHELGL